MHEEARTLLQRVLRDGRRGRAGAADRAASAARPRARTALRELRGAGRGPRAGGLDRADRGDRPLRPRAWERACELRGRPRSPARSSDTCAIGRLDGADPATPRRAERAACGRTARAWRRSCRDTPTLVGARAGRRGRRGRGRRGDRDRAGCGRSCRFPSTDDAHGELDGAILVDDAFDSCNDRLLLAAGFRTLDERERRILHLRFFAGLSQAEIAREVGISRIHVSRLIRASLERLRGRARQGRTEQRSGSSAAALGEYTPNMVGAPSLTEKTAASGDGVGGGSAARRPVARHSGKLLVRMPATLHDELAKAAEAEGVSLNQLITGALASAVGWRGSGEPRPAAPESRPGLVANDSGEGPRALPARHASRASRESRGARGRRRRRDRAARHRLASRLLALPC